MKLFSMKPKKYYEKFLKDSGSSATRTIKMLAEKERTHGLICDTARM